MTSQLLVDSWKSSFLKVIAITEATENDSNTDSETSTIKLELTGPLIWMSSNHKYCFSSSAKSQNEQSFVIVESDSAILTETNRRRPNLTTVKRSSINVLYQELNSHEVNGHLLIQPFLYGESPGPCPNIAVQPYQISVHPQVPFVCDIHSHLCEAEVIGLLAGQWNASENRMYIQAAFPCTATDRADNGATDVELDPEADWLLRQSIEQMGMCVVGWYHSHPTFKPVPSVTDIANQRMFQDTMLETKQPFVGLIVSSYDTKLVSNEADHQWFCVAPYKPDGVKTDIYLPMVLNVEYQTLQCLIESDSHSNKTLIDIGAQSQAVLDAIDNMTYTAPVEDILPPLTVVEPTKKETSLESISSSSAEEVIVASGRGGRKRKLSVEETDKTTALPATKTAIAKTTKVVVQYKDWNEDDLSEDEKKSKKRKKGGAAVKKKGVKKGGAGDKKHKEVDPMEEVTKAINESSSAITPKMTKKVVTKSMKQPAEEAHVEKVVIASTAVVEGKRPSRLRKKVDVSSIDEEHKQSDVPVPKRSARVLPLDAVKVELPISSVSPVNESHGVALDLLQQYSSSEDLQSRSQQSDDVHIRAGVLSSDGDDSPELPNAGQPVPNKVDTSLKPPHVEEDFTSPCDSLVEYKSMVVAKAEKGGARKTVTLQTSSRRPVRKVSTPQWLEDADEEVTVPAKTNKACRLAKLAAVVTAVDPHEEVSSSTKSLRGGTRRGKIDNTVDIITEPPAVPKSSRQKQKQQQPLVATTVEVPPTRVSLRAVEKISKKEFDAQQRKEAEEEHLNQEEEEEVFCEPVMKRKYSKRGGVAPVDDQSSCTPTGTCVHDKSPRSKTKKGAKKMSVLTASIKTERSSGSRRPNPKALANAQLYGSLVLSLQDSEHRSAALGRDLLSRIRPAFRMAVLSVVTMGLYYCRSSRRAPLLKKWVRNGHDDIGMFDKIGVSAARWAEMLGLVEPTNSSDSVRPHIPVLDLLVEFLRACWEDHAKGGGTSSGARRADCKHEYL